MSQGSYRQQMRHSGRVSTRGVKTGRMCRRIAHSRCSQRNSSKSRFQSGRRRNIPRCRMRRHCSPSLPSRKLPCQSWESIPCGCRPPQLKQALRRRSRRADRRLTSMRSECCSGFESSPPARQTSPHQHRRQLFGQARWLSSSRKPFPHLPGRQRPKAAPHRDQKIMQQQPSSCRNPVTT